MGSTGSTTKARFTLSRGLRHLGVGVLFIALLALFAPACLSPTLPLPPPEMPSSMHPSSTGQGLWTIAGDCDPGALVTVFNERTGQGAVVEDREKTGRYSVLIRAEVCDLAWVKQELGQDVSLRTTFEIEERSINVPVGPSVCH